MEELDQKQKNKLEKLALHDEDSSLALFEEVQQTNEILTEIRDKEMPEHKMPEVMKVQIDGVETITLKGDKGDPFKFEDLTEEQKLELSGEDGKDYILTEQDKQEIASKIKVPIVEKVIEKTEVIKEQPIVTNEIKEVAMYETGEQIIDKINENESDKKIKSEKIEGLDDRFKLVSESISSIPRGGARSNNSTKFYPLTADGVTKVFSVPKSVASIILMSDFPHILFEGSGFTINATRTQITITTDNAPTDGSQLLYQYSSQFN